MRIVIRRSLNRCASTQGPRARGKGPVRESKTGRPKRSRRWVPFKDAPIGSRPDDECRWMLFRLLLQRPRRRHSGFPHVVK